MWIGRKIADSTRAREDSTAADLGITTIGGKRRWRPGGRTKRCRCTAPGATAGSPGPGTGCWSSRAASPAQEQCVAAAEQGEAPEGMEPGDVCIRSGEASLYLHSDGRIDLTGALYINGTIYKPCECESTVPVG